MSTITAPAGLKILLHNDKYYRAVSNALYTGWQEVPKDELEIFKGVPRFRWNGGKISFELWAQVVCFLRWTQAEFKEEAMMTFFYNAKERRWAAWPFPQEPNGMTIKLLPDHEMYKVDRMRFGSDWIQAGSIHHHCLGNAFQSTTDTNDEMNRDGIHITLGKLDQQDLDIHVRSVFDNLMGDTALFDWIEMPQWIAAAPKYAQLHAFSHAIRNVNSVDFPEEWKLRIIEKKVVPYNHHSMANRVHPAGTLLTSPHTDEKSTGRSTGPGTVTPASGTEGNVNATWAEKLELRLRDVLSRLSLSDAEALLLLQQVASSKPNKFEIERREVLMEALKKDNIPHLYAEGILEKQFSSYAH